MNKRPWKSCRENSNHFQISVLYGTRVEASIDPIYLRSVIGLHIHWNRKVLIHHHQIYLISKRQDICARYWLINHTAVILFLTEELVRLKLHILLPFFLIFLGEKSRKSDCSNIYNIAQLYKRSLNFINMSKDFILRCSAALIRAFRGKLSCL